MTSQLPPDIKSGLRIKRNASTPSTFGQPTPITHPHLLRDNELVQGVTKAEFIDRRNRLMLSIQQYALHLNPNLHNHTVIHKIAWIACNFALNVSVQGDCAVSHEKIHERQNSLRLPSKLRLLLPVRLPGTRQRADNVD